MDDQIIPWSEIFMTGWIDLPEFRLWAISCLLVVLVVGLVAILLSRIFRSHAAKAHCILLVALGLITLAPAICLVANKLVQKPLALSLNLPVEFQHESAVLSNQSAQETSHLPNPGHGPLVGQVRSNRSVAKNLQQGSAEEEANSSLTNSWPAALPLPGGEATTIVTERPGRIVAWFDAVVAVWVAGALVGLFLLLWRLFQLWRFSDRLTPVIDDGSLNAMESARQQFKELGDVRLLQGNVDSPVSMSWPRRQIVVSQQVASVTPQESLQRILIHELAHIQRRDQYVLFWQKIIGCLWWPMIPVHLLNRSICQHRENLCDNFVLISGQTTAIATEYSRDLLEQTILSDNRKRNLALCTGLFARQKLENRIKRLLDNSRCLASTASTSTLACATALFLMLSGTASLIVGGPERNDRHEYVADFDAAEHDQVFISVPLTTELPANLKVEIAEETDRYLFGQIRYGSASSDRVSILVEPDGASYKLYVDRNRDRVIGATDLVEVETGVDPALRHCDLNCLLQSDSTSSKQLARKVVFRRGLLKNQIGFATLGIMRGPVTIGDRQHQMFRQDVNGNGLFNDREDRAWIDLDQDEVLDIDEQFAIRPITIIDGTRYQISIDPREQRMRVSPVTSTGSVQLALNLSDPNVEVRRLRATLTSNDGSTFTLDGMEPMVFPTGDYSITNVTVVVGKSGDSPAKSFVFTDRGSTGESRVFKVEKDLETVIDPIGKLNFVAFPGATKTGTSTMIGLRLFTEDGLLISHSHSGMSGVTIRSHAENLIQTRLIDATGKTLDGCSSGFY